MIAYGIGIIAMFIRGYWQIESKIDHLSRAFDDMKDRNVAADEETEEVKKKQVGLEMTVAVMAEQIVGMSKSQERVEACVTEIARELRTRAK